MLQHVGHEHDNHYLSDQSNSIEALVASKSDGKRHLLLAASGSVATIKIPVIAEALAKYEDTLSIRIVLTQSATHFLAGQSVEQPTISSLLHLPNVDAVYRDRDEWGPQPWRRGASILHIELRRWADMLVVAPLSANTLAKVVNGMSDNLLTSVIRAWDTDASIDQKQKVILVAPAMNSAMWRNPITEKQLRVLSDDWGWFQVIAPISKTLACGDTGDDQAFYNTAAEEAATTNGANPAAYTGAMASVDSICEAVAKGLGL